MKILKRLKDKFWANNITPTKINENTSNSIKFNKINDSQIMLLTDENYSKFLDSPIPSSDQFKIIDVFIKKNEYFKANQTIFTLGSEVHGSGILYINFPFGGKINSYLVNKNNSIKINNKLLNVKRIDNINLLNQKVLEQNLLNLNQTEISYLEDEFTNDKTIKVTKLANEDTEYFSLYLDQSNSADDFLSFTLVNHNGYTYISFYSSNEDITLSKNDRVILLFDDKSKLDIVFTNAGEGTKGQRFNSHEIGFDELNTLLNKNLIKGKMISSRKNLYSVYNMNHEVNLNQKSSYNKKALYQTELEGQFLLQLMVQKFIQVNQKYKLNKN